MMQLKHSIRKCFAILLIVVFGFKAGGGLFLHNYTHIKNNFSASATGSKEIKFACSCIIDFYSPLTETAQQKINSPFLIYEELNFSYPSSILSSTSFFYSLRAPPVI